MNDKQSKKFIDWLDKVLISSAQDTRDNYHTSGRKYYEGYYDALIDIKMKIDYLLEKSK